MSIESVSDLSENSKFKPLAAQQGSTQLSCCSSDLSEFENLKTIEKQVFKSAGKEKVPDYLKGGHPPKEGEPCREYLMTLKKWGERPPAEAFMKIANQIYIDHCIKEDKKLAAQLKKAKGGKDAGSKKGEAGRKRHKSTGRTGVKRINEMMG